MSAVFPCNLCPNVVDEKPHALIVGWIQPEHAVEDAPSLLEPAQTPEAQPESIHATEKRPIVDQAPRQQAIEGFSKRQFTDPEPRLVVTNRILGPPVENQVAEMRVGIQAAKIRLAEFHQYAVCSRHVAGVLPVVGFNDGIGERIVRVLPGQYLLQFELAPRAPGNNRLGPLLDGLILLAPVVLARIPCHRRRSPQVLRNAQERTPRSARPRLAEQTLYGETRRFLEIGCVSNQPFPESWLL